MATEERRGLFDSCFVNSERIPAISGTCLIACRRRETLFEEIYGVQALIGDGVCIKGAARAGSQQTWGSYYWSLSKRSGIRSRLKLRGVRRLLVFLSESARKLQKRERQRRLSPNGHRDSGRDGRQRSLQKRVEILLPLISAQERHAETVDISHRGTTVIVPPVACHELNFILGQFEVQ